MVDLVDEEVGEHDVDRVSACFTVRVCPPTLDLETFWAETFAERYELTIGDSLCGAQAWKIRIEFAIEGTRLGVLAPDHRYVEAVDQQNMVERAVNRSEEGTPISEVVLNRELCARPVEAVVAPEVVAGHRSEMFDQARHGNLLEPASG
jgi:hypothetical protein